MSCLRAESFFLLLLCSHSTWVYFIHRPHCIPLKKHQFSWDVKSCQYYLGVVKETSLFDSLKAKLSMWHLFLFVFLFLIVLQTFMVQVHILYKNCCKHTSEERIGSLFFIDLFFLFWADLLRFVVWILVNGTIVFYCIITSYGNEVDVDFGFASPE